MATGTGAGRRASRPGLVTNRRRRWVLPTAVLAIAVMVVGTVATTAGAATGCRVDYAVTNQWQGGFQARVAVTNLGDPVTSWRLTWSFAAGQAITQLWDGAFTQSGAQVSVANAGYNGAIPSGGSVAFGFNGSWSGGNPAPASFALDGTVCTGAPSSGSTTTTSATTTPPTTTPPTTTPPTTRPPTTAPPATGPPTTRPPGTPPASYPNPGRVTGDVGTHDPSVVRAPDGSYILVATGNGLAIKTSTDRTTWRNAGAVWPGGAPWTTAYTGGSRNLWAPDISFRNGQFYLYYSASTFGSQRSAIFLATSPTGAAGSWTDRGMVIESSGAVDYNAIDPNLIVDAQGQWWLSFGSFWTGIKLIRLDPATGRRSTSDTAVRSLARRPTAGGAIEAPIVYRRGGFYYLFVSFDLCCRGTQSTYRVMVGRSTSVLGPYLDRDGVAMTSGGGTELLAAHGSVHGPGHQAVIADSDAEVLFYHYYADSGASLLGINLIGWDAAGWPFVF